MNKITAIMVTLPAMGGLLACTKSEPPPPPPVAAPATTVPAVTKTFKVS